MWRCRLGTGISPSCGSSVTLQIINIKLSLDSWRFLPAAYHHVTLVPLRTHRWLEFKTAPKVLATWWSDNAPSFKASRTCEFGVTGRSHLLWRARPKGHIVMVIRSPRAEVSDSNPPFLTRQWPQFSIFPLLVRLPVCRVTERFRTASG